MEQLNVAVVGCGDHAQTHFELIAAEPRVRLAAIAEIDADRRERALAEHGPERAFADYREMLEKCDLDIVYVTTMPGHLLQIVLDCLAQGLHVSVEKSPGMSSEETQQMADAANNSKGKAVVSFDRRYKPEVLAVRRRVRERGGAVHCGAIYNKPATRLAGPGWVESAPDPLIADAIHHVDLLRWLAGDSESSAAIPTEVYAEVQDGDRPGAHRQNAVIRFDTGAIATMSSNYYVGFRIQRAEVHAEDFSAYLDLTRVPRVEIYDRLDSDTPLDLDAAGVAGSNETRHFVDCILEDRTPWSTLDDAVHTMRLCEAIRRGHKGAL